MYIYLSIYLIYLMVRKADVFVTKNLLSLHSTQNNVKFQYSANTITFHTTLH